MEKKAETFEKLKIALPVHCCKSLKRLKNRKCLSTLLPETLPPEMGVFNFSSPKTEMLLRFGITLLASLRNYFLDV